MSFNAMHENKILAKISKSTVLVNGFEHGTRHISGCCSIINPYKNSKSGLGGVREIELFDLS